MCLIAVKIKCSYKNGNHRSPEDISNQGIIHIATNGHEPTMVSSLL